MAGNEISRLFCAAGGSKAQRRATAWGPWDACSGSTCESIFQSVYNAGSDALVVTRDASVDNWGGMSQRTCRFGSYPYYQNVTCYYIDPDLAQGDTAWRTAGYGPSPITDGFYANSNVSSGAAGPSTDYYRHWLDEQTNYGFDIYGVRNKGGDARKTTQKSWGTASLLCDLNTGRGC